MLTLLTLLAITFYRRLSTVTGWSKFHALLPVCANRGRAYLIPQEPFQVVVTTEKFFGSGLRMIPPDSSQIITFLLARRNLPAEEGHSRSDWWCRTDSRTVPVANYSTRALSDSLDESRTVSVLA